MELIMKRMLIFCVIFFASHAIAKSTVDLIEEALLHDQKTNFETISDYGVNLLIKEGILEKKPFATVDYQNYYLPLIKINFLGAQLVAYDYESYNNGSVGCCPNEGTALVLLPLEHTEDLKIFAEKNNCLFENADLNINISSMLLKKMNASDFKKLSILSCKYNELMEAQKVINPN